MVQKLQVEGMDCANCALTINKYLTGKGLQEVKVNFIDGEVNYTDDDSINIEEIKSGINKLGYTVVENKPSSTSTIKKSSFKMQNNLHRFWFCMIFTLPLLLHMLPGVHIHFLMQPLVQLCLTVPVYIMGLIYFGRSAWRSLLSGIPNMNVLITLGSTAAFGYSMYGFLMHKGTSFLFFETVATTITLVFMGNWLEEKSIATTQTELNKLVVEQKQTANMIAFDAEHQEQVFEVAIKDLRVGDLLLLKSGEIVPADCKILWGDVSVSEALITGESIPIEKKMKDILVGGSVVESGTAKAYVTAVGDEAVLNKVLKLAKDAQTEKPPIQKLADRISAVFVPAVVALAVITVVVNYFFLHLSFAESLLRSIAVLVISCPCAMGLATPAAIAVGWARASKNGVLFKSATSLELFKNIKQIVFDKTGTLTNGEFSIKNYALRQAQGDNGIKEDKIMMSDDAFKRLVFSLEKYSNHPIATSVAKAFYTKDEIRWATIEEIKGFGMKALDKEGNECIAGSYSFAKHLTDDDTHNIYIIQNNQLTGWIDVEDAIRPEAKEVIQYFKQHHIKTILLSGDRKDKAMHVAQTLGLDEVIAEQTPADKLVVIEELNRLAPTAMVGDGINDAPALAKATIGVSFSNASQIAMQHANVLLMKNSLKGLPTAIQLGKHTYLTIQQNLFWALAYNVVAIPVAGLGYLGKYGPTIGALIMGLSDVVLVVNSVRLRWKRLD